VNVLKLPPCVNHVVFSRVFSFTCLYTTSREVRDAEVTPSIRARRVYLDLLFIAGMERSISAPFVVGDNAVGARIIRDSSVFINLMLLQLFHKRLLEYREAERERWLEQLMWVCSWCLFLYDESWDEELRCVATVPPYYQCRKLRIRNF